MEEHSLRGRLSDKLIQAKPSEPPHRAFANLGWNPESPRHPRCYASNEQILSFVKQYGPLHGKHRNFEVHFGEFRILQETLRQAWDAGDARFFIPNTDERKAFDAVVFVSLNKLETTWKATPSGIELYPIDCLASMGILLARDLGEGIAKKCGNPRCPAPYYLAHRRDQKFCEHYCAVTENNARNRRKKR